MKNAKWMVVSGELHGKIEKFDANRLVEGSVILLDVPKGKGNGLGWGFDLSGSANVVPRWLWDENRERFCLPDENAPKKGPYRRKSEKGRP